MTTPQQMQSQLITTMTETWAGAARAVHRENPHGDAVPGPSEFVDQFFDFWVQLLEAQRGLVLSAINALVPSAPVQVAGPTPSTARPATDGTTSGSVVIPTTTTAPTAESTADEHIDGAAADAIATAAAITAEKTATVTKAPEPEKTSPKKSSTAGKTSPTKKSAAKKSSTAKKTSTAKQKRS